MINEERQRELIKQAQVLVMAITQRKYLAAQDIINEINMELLGVHSRMVSNEQEELDRILKELKK